MRNNTSNNALLNRLQVDVELVLKVTSQRLAIKASRGEVKEELMFCLRRWQADAKRCETIEEQQRTALINHALQIISANFERGRHSGDRKGHVNKSHMLLQDVL